MEKQNVWFITAKTNLHVGNENTSSYGLIDKAIQRDALTNLPCINSSSLKGALNEYATNEAKLDSQKRIEIFGVDKGGQSKDTKKGNYTFFDANLLFLPKQDNTIFYKLVTCDAILNRFFNKMKIFGITLGENDLTSISYEKISEKDFIDLCSDDNLPIIARNALENGESKNLWYEQVLPAETVLYTIIDDKKDNSLSTELLKDNAIVQIGANATIGYGYCKFSNL